MSREQTIQAITQYKLISIIRGIETDKTLKVAQALYDGGIRMLEVTFNQKTPASWQATADAITAIAKQYEGRMLVGAGTITSTELVDIAAKAGARYILSPDTNIDVIKRTRELGIVSIPGAMTPSEIIMAHNTGADLVKLFPAGSLGLDYVKAIIAPVNHVKLLAVGGIHEENIRDFLAAGIVGAGIGGNLVNAKWIANGEFDRITQTASKLVSIVKE